MKKIAALLLGGSLIFSLVALAEPKEADQKWLGAVEKMVTSGQSKVSTPSEDRVNLLKEWAGKNGYSVSTTKTRTGYTIEISKKVVAQK